LPWCEDGHWCGQRDQRDTTGAAVGALLEHPDVQGELRADPAAMLGAVDEMLRWWTPVMTFRRR
jgi:cytochrome P450